jgi:hypothetical protein
MGPVPESSGKRSSVDVLIDIGSARVSGASDGGGTNACEFVDCVEKLLGGILVSGISVMAKPALSVAPDLWPLDRELWVLECCLVANRQKLAIAR